jgi:hypothetical protein
MRTIVYVDGFNLYYGALKGTPYRWLDILAMARKILSPKNQIVGMKYFTARVLPRPDNPGQPLRQEIYLRALRSLGADCIFGRYLSHPVMMRVADTNAAKPFVRVIKTEEKGSDVNIAAHMLLDAFRNEYDCAVGLKVDEAVSRADCGHGEDRRNDEKKRDDDGSNLFHDFSPFYFLSLDKIMISFLRGFVNSI